MFLSLKCRNRLKSFAFFVSLTSIFWTHELVAQEKKDLAEPIADYSVPQMAIFEGWIGVWNVTEHHFDSKGHVISKVKGTEEVNWILDKRAIRRSYRTKSASRSYHAIGTLTWDASQSRYSGTWYDDASTTGPTLTHGTWSESTKVLEFVLESRAADGSAVTYRIVDKWHDEKHRQVTTYQVRGDALVKRLEVEYQRPAPCPETQQSDRMIGVPDID